MGDKDENVKQEEVQFEKKEQDEERLIDPGNEHNHLDHLTADETEDAAGKNTGD